MTDDDFLASLKKRNKESQAKLDATLDKAFNAAIRSVRQSAGMKCPSSGALTSAFTISSSDAKKIRTLCKLADQPETLAEFIETQCPETQKYVRSMHSDPYRSSMWRRTVVLDAIDNVLGAHGVEALGPNRYGTEAPPYEYINMGDTYATTLIYKRSSDRLSIGSWGDIVERYGSAWE
jgi:hypothetical protein